MQRNSSESGSRNYRGSPEPIQASRLRCARSYLEAPNTWCSCLAQAVSVSYHCSPHHESQHPSDLPPALAKRTCLLVFRKASRTSLSSSFLRRASSDVYMILTTTIPGTTHSPLGCLSSSPVLPSTHSQNSKVISSNAAILGDLFTKDYCT